MSVPAEALTRILSERTFALKEQMWATSFAENLPLIRSEGNVYDLPKGAGSALILGGGPSVTDLGALKQYGGTIFASDKMLIPLLQSGTVPFAAGTVDGDPSLISFYDNPVVDQHRDEVLSLLATYVYPTVAKRIPFRRFWFNVIFDDPVHPKCPSCGYELKNSLTRATYWMSNRKVMMNAGGNIGTWLTGLAATLGYSPVILYGIDFSYGDNQAPTQTPYWKGLLDIYKGDTEKTVAECYRYVDTPTGKRVLTDIVMDSYRDTLLKAFGDLKTEVVNVSQYSTVFGGRVKHMGLTEALKDY